MAFRKSFEHLINSAVKFGASVLSRRGLNNVHTGSSAVFMINSQVSTILFGLGLGLGLGVVGFGGLPLQSVNALSLWKKSPDGSDEADSDGIKIRNKQDAELLKDIKAADRTYKIDEGISQSDVYKLLSKHKDKSEPELLWRLARITYELSKKAKGNDREKLIHEAYETIQKALALDENNFAIHKWMAILLNARSTLLGTKEQITQSYNVRKHMERAAELNPKDATSIYLIGNWCFTVAEIPWYQKKIASTIFASPPSCSFAEAVEHFLKAETTEPLFYSMNLLMLAKSYMRLGYLEKAEMYLLQLKSMPMVTDEDYQARQEGRELLDQITKSRVSRKPKAGAAADDVAAAAATTSVTD